MNKKLSIVFSVLAPLILIALIMGSSPVFARPAENTLVQDKGVSQSIASIPNVPSIQNEDINLIPVAAPVQIESIVKADNPVIEPRENIDLNPNIASIQSVGVTLNESNIQFSKNDPDENVNLIASVAPVQNVVSNQNAVPNQIAIPEENSGSNPDNITNNNVSTFECDRNDWGRGSAPMNFSGNLVKNGYNIKYTVKVRADIDGSRGGLPVCDMDANASISATPLKHPRNRPITAHNDIERHGVMTGAYGTYQFSTSLPVRFDSTQVTFVIKIIDTIKGNKHHLSVTVTAS
jgi:hypothetical protein